MPKEPPPLKHTVAQVEAAYKDWGFNCGPGALCALLGKTPDEIHPHLSGFDRKRYTNPQMMYDALNSLGVRWSKKTRRPLRLPMFGLARVQWGGPWCKKGKAAAQRHTHWIAAIEECSPVAVFDVNNPSSWVSFKSWQEVLVPWILKQYEPGADGTYWLTHSVEIHEDAPSRLELSHRLKKLDIR